MTTSTAFYQAQLDGHAAVLEAGAAALKQHALENYSQGGHWIYETHCKADYIRILADCELDLGKAKRQLKADWELACEMHDNTRFE